MTDLLAELNRDLWHPFGAAYGSLDIEAFLALNRTDLIRASGTGKLVHGYDEYAAQMRAFFGRVRAQNDRLAIEFRFHERLAAGDVASERGVFLLKVDPNVGDPRRRYGRFHTLARKTDGRWRFAADYDSDDDADAAAFEAGAAVDDLARFSSS